MNETPLRACDLCGLPIEVPNFYLTTVNGEKRFCCEGCLGIYQMLNESEVVSTTNGESPDSTGAGH